ncbi:GntP family permease [Peribacillus simplex]|uniref:GntP family permease n=1 Tax=Peribacillus simplex TaxID=1478 RepID=A0A9X8R9G0_9BACI|nr:GntP family permease [Peribacillus simplex]
MIKELLNLTGAQTLKSWTMETIKSVVSLILILLLSSIV